MVEQLFFLVEMYHKIQTRILRIWGLYPSACVILYFLKDGEECSMGNLGEKCAMKPSRLTKTLDEMKHIGLIARRVSTEDSRVVLADITDQGLEVYQLCRNEVESLMVSEKGMVVIVNFYQALVDRAKTHGLTSTQIAILCAAYLASEKAITIGALATACRLNRTTVSMALRHLGETGFIVDEGSDEKGDLGVDRRCRRVAITKRGAAFLECFAVDFSGYFELMSKGNGR